MVRFEYHWNEINYDNGNHIKDNNNNDDKDNNNNNGNNNDIDNKTEAAAVAAANDNNNDNDNDNNNNNNVWTKLLNLSANSKTLPCLGISLSNLQIAFFILSTLYWHFP